VLSIMRLLLDGITLKFSPQLMLFTAINTPFDSKAVEQAIARIILTVPPLVFCWVGAVGVAQLRPAEDVETRRHFALAFIALIVILLFVVKLPALQQAISYTTLRTTFPDWQWFGFSYIAFRLMHILLDYRSGRLPVLPLADFALYVTFFPALPAGPIDRVERFKRELDQPRELDSRRVGEGLRRIGMGLFKKFIIADLLAYFALSPELVQQTTQGLPLTMWLMLYAYSFRLFFDFSGYSDIAIGIGILAGLTLPENFANPYGKRNITQFWNSWHMSLSTWFRNYVFTPFSRALMRTRLRSRRLTMILMAQVVTMVLIGLWHAVAWNFVLWGLWHGVGLWFHKWLTERTRAWDEVVQARPRLRQAVHILSILTTFHFVALGWVFFALPDLSLIRKVLAGLLGLAN